MCCKALAQPQPCRVGRRHPAKNSMHPLALLYSQHLRLSPQRQFHIRIKEGPWIRNIRTCKLLPPLQLALALHSLHSLLGRKRRCVKRRRCVPGCVLSVMC